MDVIQVAIEQEIERTVSNLLEDSRGREQITALETAIDSARQERDQHKEGSYYYNLITQDIQAKEDQLQRYEKEYIEARDITAATDKYKERILDLLDFVNVTRGKYHNATFQKKKKCIGGIRCEISHP